MTTTANMHDMQSNAKTSLISNTGSLLAWLLPAGVLFMLWQSNPLQSSARTVPVLCQNSGMFTDYQDTRSRQAALLPFVHYYDELQRTAGIRYTRNVRCPVTVDRTTGKAIVATPFCVSKTILTAQALLPGLTTIILIFDGYHLSTTGAFANLVSNKMNDYEQFVESTTGICGGRCSRGHRRYFTGAR